MVVGLDARFLSKIDQGTASYTTQLVKGLLPLMHSDRLLLLNKGGIPEGMNSGSVHHGPLSSNFAPANVLWGYGRAEKKYKLDILHTNYLTGLQSSSCKKVVTIHDILFKTHPEFFPLRLRKGVDLLSAWSLPKADHIITVSNYSKNRIEEHYPFLKRKVSVIYEAASEDFYFIEDRKKVADELQQHYGFTGPYVLFVGRFAPMKNLETLVDWFVNRTDKSGLKLVLVGKPDSAFPNPRLEGLLANHSEIRVLQNVNNRQLNLLYNGARLFYFVSHGEGFGLPILEAMAAGCPVLTSTTTACPEIAGAAGFCVNPRDKEAVFGALDRLVEDDARLRAMQQSGFERAEMFSWNQCAKETYGLYKTLMNEGGYTA